MLDCQPNYIAFATKASFSRTSLFCACKLAIDLSDLFLYAEYIRCDNRIPTKRETTDMKLSLPNIIVPIPIYLPLAFIASLGMTLQAVNRDKAIGVIDRVQF